MASPTRDPNAWNSPFEDLLVQDTAPTGREVIRPNPTFGTPDADATHWEGQQRLPDDCAIKSQQFLLEQFTGQPVSEETLVREAIDHGWYTPGRGTSPADVGNLLELHGVPVTHYQHASQFHLAHELAQGHKVIVGVECDVLWHRNSLLEALRELLGIHGTADHAVVVSGIDTSDPQHVRVLVSDPGTGQALASYPMEQFLEAWRGSDFFMVATQDPAPAHLPEMAHFDYAVGHIADVGGVPYEQFLGYAGHPAAFADAVHHATVAAHYDSGHHFHQHPMSDGHAAEQAGHDFATGGHLDPLTDHHEPNFGHSDTTGHTHHDHPPHDVN